MCCPEESTDNPWKVEPDGAAAINATAFLVTTLNTSALLVRKLPLEL